MTASLVYVRHATGLTAQIWAADAPAWSQPKKERGRYVVAEHALTVEEAALPIDVLVAKYPAPKEDIDAAHT
mgnify:CR=1 FL=1